jgi:hypothetical protein
MRWPVVLLPLALCASVVASSDAQLPVRTETRTSRPPLTSPSTSTGLATLRRQPAPGYAALRKLDGCSVDISWAAAEGAKEYVVSNVVEGTYVRPVRSPFGGHVTHAVTQPERHERSLRVSAPALSKTLDHSAYGGSNVTHRYSVTAVGTDGNSSLSIAAGNIAACDGPSFVTGRAFVGQQVVMLQVSPAFPW